MPEVITRRKFALPALPEPHVERPHLRAILAEGLAPGKQLTLIQGGPGSGKTALLAEYARRAGAPVAWLGLTPAEQDPVVFFEHLAACLSHACPGLSGQAATLARTTGRDGLPQAMGLLCDDLAAALTRPLVLVVDATEHMPGDEASLQAFEVLASSFPPEAQLVFSGRMLPGIKLAQWRLRGQVVQIEDPDLRLRPEDLAAFVDVYDADEAQIPLLAERTRGWVGGVVYALATQPADPARSLERPELLYDYLSEEVYARLPEALRGQLLALAHMDGLEPGACRALLGAEADAALEAIAVLPFVHRGDDSLAFHPIFQEFLRRTARTALDAPARQELFRSLAERVARTPEEAIRWLLQGALWQDAESRLLAATPGLLREGRMATIRALLADFPFGIVRTSARLRYIQAETARRSGNLALALEQFGEAEELGRETKGDDILGLVWAGLAATHGARGDTDRQREYAERALEALPDSAREAAASCLNVLGTYHLVRREPEQAEVVLRRAQNRYEEAGDAAGVGRVLHNLGLAAAIAGSFDRAIGLYRDSIARLEQAGYLPLPVSYANEALCLHYLGRTGEAWAAVETGMSVAERMGARRDRVFLLQTLGRLYMSRGEAARARETFELALVEAQQTGNRSYEVNTQMALAEWHLREGDLQAVKRAVDRAIAAAGRDLTDPGLLEALLLMAEAELSAGQLDEALNRLGQASESLAAAPDPYSALHLERLWRDWHIQRGERDAAEAREAAIDAICLRHGFPRPPGLRPAPDQPAPQTVPVLDVAVLGGFKVAVEGREIGPRTWRAAGGRLVLIHLLLNPSGATKESLIELLYPEDDPAKSALHVTINRLRQALEPEAPKGTPSRFVLFHDGRYLLNPGLHVQFDVSEFRKALRDARRQEGEARAEALDRALSLYRGPFLEEFPEVEWCRIERENIRRQALEAFEERFASCAGTDDWRALESHADRLIALEPAAEVAYRAKMVALGMLERPADALRIGRLAHDALAKAGAALEPETRDLLESLEAVSLTVRAAREALPSRW